MTTVFYGLENLAGKVSAVIKVFNVDRSRWERSTGVRIDAAAI